MFLSDVGAIANDSNTMTLGLYWLGIIAEDLVSPLDTSVSAVRQRELRRLLEAEAPGIVAFLSMHLVSTDHRIALLALDALARFVAMLPLQLVPLDGIRDQLFMLVRKAIDGSPADLPLAMRAIACVIELFSRSFVPAEAEASFIGQFRSVCDVLQLAADNILRIDTDFLERLVHVVHLLVTLHIARLERLADALMLPFLSLLARLSAAQTTSALFLQCVDLWLVLLDHVATQQAALVSRGQLTVASTYVATYQSSILSFAQPLLERVQFAFFAADLEALREQDEFEAFVVRCVELLSQMAHLYPTEVVTATHAWCMAQTAPLLSAGASINAVDTVLLRDAATSLRALGALADLFEPSPTTTPAEQHERAELAHSAMERAIAIARVCTVPGPSESVLQVHAQVFGFFDAFATWLASLSSPAVVSTLLELAFPMIGSADETVAELAAKVIRSLAEKVCRDGFSSYAPMRQLIESFASVAGSLPVAARRQLAVACSAALLSSSSDGAGGYAQFVAQVVAPLNDESVLLGTDIVRAVGGASHTQRQVACQAFVPVLEAAFGLVGSLVSEPTRLSALIEMVAVAFGSLRAELGDEFTQAAAQLFLQLFDNPLALEAVVASESNDTSLLLCRYLAFMAQLAAEPVAARSGLAVGVLSFARSRAWPVVERTGLKAVDVALELLNVLFKVTLAHFKWLQRETAWALDLVLQVFVSALSVRADLAVVRSAVDNLRSLHDKVKLFDSAQFRAQHAAPMALAVLSLLAGRGHDVIRDSLLELLHALVVHDLPSFSAHIAPALLIAREANGADANEALTTLCNQIVSAVDQPTFFDVVTEFTDAVHRIDLSRKANQQ